MKIASFAFYLRVNNLDVCRSFYRDLLELGTPVIDSNFLVEFVIQPDIRLILDHSEADFLEHSSSAGAFTFFLDDPDALVARISESGYELHAKEITRHGEKMIRCLDPEGNPFFLAGKKENTL